jgi:hypothetical protein
LAPLSAEDIEGSPDKKPNKWTARTGSEDSEESGSESESGSEEFEFSSGDEEGDQAGSSKPRKAEPVQPIIQVENPNRVSAKSMKISDMANQKTELSRREREAIQAAQAKQRYEKLHAEGKTDQAKADLTRLKAIREQREAAAAKRKEETAEKERLAKDRLATSGRSLKKN